VLVLLGVPRLPPVGLTRFFLFFGFLGFVCFLFFCFLFSGSLCVFFKLAKQHKSEGPRPNSLPVLSL
jgi:hypothetical protein